MKAARFDGDGPPRPTFPPPIDYTAWAAWWI
jgi:hypothetical protein